MNYPAASGRGIREIPTRRTFRRKRRGIPHPEENKNFPHCHSEWRSMPTRKHWWYDHSLANNFLTSTRKKEMAWHVKSLLEP